MVFALSAYSSASIFPCVKSDFVFSGAQLLLLISLHNGFERLQYVVIL